jgi:hypothetical protein
MYTYIVYFDVGCVGILSKFTIINLYKKHTQRSCVAPHLVTESPRNVVQQSAPTKKPAICPHKATHDPCQSSGKSRQSSG